MRRLPPSRCLLRCRPPRCSAWIRGLRCRWDWRCTCPSFKPTRTPPSTYGNGRSEMASAAAAPAIASELGSCSGSAESTMAMICVSCTKPFGKQRPDRPIDQPAGENFFFRGTPLALDEAARNFSGGVSVFAIVHRERKEARSRFGLFGHASGDEHDRVPERTTTAPFACLAILPVSRVIFRPPRSTSTV